jgi:chemosensory pili system protein ChpA (sensor histidine kinase/response regulator)
MPASAQFNALPLLTVKPALDDALIKVSSQLATYFSTKETDKPALQTALSGLHQAIGVLQMLSLNGVVVLCNEIEGLLKTLQTQAAPASAMQRNALNRGLPALVQYLDALADGAPNVTLRLFHPYQDLLQARGIEMAFEDELFFPNLNVQLPAEVLAIPLQYDALAQVKKARASYQQALLKWLRQESMEQALQAMQQAVAQVLSCIPAGIGRGFWWVASGLLDNLIEQIALDEFIGSPLPTQNTKKLLGRIDSQMRATLEQRDAPADAVLGEMLYLLAHSDTTSDTIRRIRETYALAQYLPAESLLSLEDAGKVLDAMRVLLTSTEDTLIRCVTEDGSELYRSLLEQTAQLSALSNKLDRDTLQFLCKKIHQVAEECQAIEGVQRCAMDMALCLLLLGSGITHYRHLSCAFQEQAQIATQRLQATVSRNTPDESAFAHLIELYCQMNVRAVMIPLAAEMQDNLQQIESVLTAFFADPSGHTKLAPLDALIKQVSAGLFILSLDVAVELLEVLQQNITGFRNGILPSQAALRAIANTLSTLEEYVRDLMQGQVSDAAPLTAALQDLSTLQSRTMATATPVPLAAMTIHQPIKVVDQADGEDNELLEIFLEEAQEVLQIMRSNLEVCHLHSSNSHPLITIRRGFHTLKGSGRMVGLSDLGEVAWSLERAMNKWLSSERPATAGLLYMIDQAIVLFGEWVEGLAKHSELVLDPSALVDMAQCIENDQVVEVPAPALTQEVAPDGVATVAVMEASVPTEAAASEVEIDAEAEVAAEVEAESETVQILDASEALPLDVSVAPEVPPPAPVEPAPIVVGDISISATLFHIATEEATTHIATLKHQLNSLRGAPPHVVHYNFMRAAHTLAGVNRSMGFTQVADVAYALELWLEAHLDKPFAMPEQQLALLDNSVARLDEMVIEILNQQTPAPQAELIAKLQAAKESIVSAEEPLAESAAAPLPSPVSERPVVAVAQPTEPDADQRQIQDDVDEQLLPIFLEEAQDLHPQIGSDLRAWRDNSGDAKLGQRLQRSLHTLKGSARMAGAMRLGELTHRVESRVDLAIAQARYDAALWEEMDNYLDRISHAIDRLRGVVVEEENTLPSSDQAAAVVALDDTMGLSKTQAISASVLDRVTQSALLRVRSDTVDRLVNEAGEISVARLRVETELRDMKTALLELTGSIDRLHKQLREIEIHAESQMQAHTSLGGDSAEKFDPLEFDRFTRFQELTRFMNESVHDVQTVQQTLLRNLDETASALSAQNHINRELQQSLLSIRMVPFAGVGERLYRIVRQTGKELGKKANLELRGTELELDRSVLEKMTAPFEHLLRNAISHGLESPAEREQKGKPPIGEVRLSLRQENNEVVFEFSDDGAGLDLPRLRAKAVAHGLLQADEDASDEQIMQLIFASGMSTASEVTEISGRGVGMDVVRSEITALGGRIDVSSVAGQGARFMIRLPLTLAVTQALMVQAGSTTYAVPSVMVEQVQQIKPAVLAAAYQAGQIVWQDKIYPLHYFAHLLGDTDRVHEPQPYNPILLLRSGEQRCAIHLDGLIGNREAVVKNIGPQLARLPGMVGATVLGDGQVVLIINPVALTQRLSVVRQRKVEVAVAADEPVVVMVVDDSLTVRKITSRFLTRQGYIVVTANDGVDAIEQLEAGVPTVMLLDVEMPRMDGFELAKHLRRDPRTQGLPIIMITSRTADKHREYAMEIGVNAYLGKPYQEDVLLEAIQKFLPKA